jgi:hypothetical protein
LKCSDNKPNALSALPFKMSQTTKDITRFCNSTPTPILDTCQQIPSEQDQINFTKATHERKKLAMYKKVY